MLLPLLENLPILDVFTYVTVRAAYSAITAVLISIVFGPPVIKLLKKIKIGQTIREDGPQTHLSKSGTPTMGGVLIIISIVVSMLLWQDLTNPYVWIAMGGFVLFGIIGFIDDALKIFFKNSKGLQARFKFGGQVLVSALVVTFLVLVGSEESTWLYFPFVKEDFHLDIMMWYIPFGILLLVTMSNAVNITDGLDGLAIGLVLLMALTFGIIAYLSGHINYAEYLNIPFIEHGAELSILCFTLAGASVGFLWFNAHPAQIMMGDTGSLSLGGLLGIISMLLKKEILLVIIAGVFAMELLSVVIQVVSYKLRKKRVFRMAPLHHHFELQGWAESKVVIRLWILGGMFAILSLSTLKLQ